MINVLRDIMNRTSVLTFNSIYCKTPWPVQCPLMHCLSSAALRIRDLLWIFIEYSLQPYFWKGTWHPVLWSPVNEHFISELALKCYSAVLVFVSVCIKPAQSQTIKNSTLKQRAVSIRIDLRAWEITWAPKITMDFCFSAFSWLLVELAPLLLGRKPRSPS